MAKKTVKKAVRKTAKKPTARKKSAPAKGRKRARAAHVPITYSCASSVLRIAPRLAHMSPGDVVDMKAVNTDVTLTFANSPFTSGATNIFIRSGKVHNEFVKLNANGRFPYTASSPNCGSAFAPPEMIVP